MAWDDGGNWVDDGTDPNVGANPTWDIFGSQNAGGWNNDPSAWDPNSNSVWSSNGLWGGVSDAVKAAFSGLGGALSGGLGSLSPLFASILGGPGGKGWGSVIPGTLALAYADRQPGIDTSGIESVRDRLQGNEGAIIRAATDPLQANIAAGYGDLLQSQAKRGIRGSSFGDSSIGNYIDTTGRGLANAGASAAAGSLSLEGTLAGNIAQLKQKSQEMKNALFGRAFDTLGRGLNPAGYGMYPSTGGNP